MRAPWQRLGHCKEAVTDNFSRKISWFSCVLTVLWKIKQLRGNAVETPPGVTGVLRKENNQVWEISEIRNLNYRSVSNSLGVRFHAIVFPVLKGWFHFSVRFRLGFYCVPGTQGISESWVPCKFYWVPESFPTDNIFICLFFFQC